MREGTSSIFVLRIGRGFLWSGHDLVEMLLKWVQLWGIRLLLPRPRRALNLGPVTSVALGQLSNVLEHASSWAWPVLREGGGGRGKVSPLLVLGRRETEGVGRRGSGHDGREDEWHLYVDWESPCLLMKKNIC